MSVNITEISSKKSVIYNSSEEISSEMDSEFMDGLSSPQVAIEFDESYKHKDVYDDYCKFGEFVLKIFYDSIKNAHSIPRMYRLTLNGNYSRIDRFRKMSLKHFFRFDYQDVVDNYLDIIGKIHRSNIREAVRSQLDSKKKACSILIGSLFRIPDLDVKFTRGDVDLKFNTSTEIVANRGSMYLGSDHFTLYLNVEKLGNYPSVSCKLYFNGNLKVQLFFENIHIRDREFYKELTALDLDRDYYQ